MSCNFIKYYHDNKYGVVFVVFLIFFYSCSPKGKEHFNEVVKTNFANPKDSFEIVEKQGLSELDTFHYKINTYYKDFKYKVEFPNLLLLRINMNGNNEIFKEDWEKQILTFLRKDSSIVHLPIIMSYENNIDYLFYMNVNAGGKARQLMDFMDSIQINKTFEIEITSDPEWKRASL